MAFECAVASAHSGGPLQVFSFLADDIAHNVRINGEFQFTPALQRLREAEGGLLGLVVDGQRFDIGTPASYLHTLTTYSRPAKAARA